MLLLQISPSEQGSNWVELRSAYSAPVVEQFRAMPGLQWDAGRRVWRAPLEAAQPVVALLEKAKVIVPKWVMPPKPEATPLPSRAADALYGYQREGVAWIEETLATYGSAILGDDPGLGKSAQALHALPPGRALILCPAVVARHWEEQARKWVGAETVRLDASTPKRRAAALERWADDARPSPTAICSYDTFKGLKELPSCDALVLDELHYLCNQKSARSKAVRAYVEEHSPWLIGLTGTLMPARPRDLWHPLDLLFPRRFGRYFNFTARYAGGRWVPIPGREKPAWDDSGASNLDELRLRLRPLMLRRERGAVLDLPHRNRIAMPVEIPPAALERLRGVAFEACDGASLSSALSSVEEYKIKAAIEHAEDLTANGKRVLIYTTRRESAKQIAEALGVVAVDGATDSGDRQAALAASRIGVATMYSVTTGIDLVDFDVVIFVGLDWLPSTLEQAESRVYRIGQVNPVDIYYLIGIGTVDEIVRARVIERLDHISSVTGASNRDIRDGLQRTAGSDPLLEALLAAAKAA